MPEPPATTAVGRLGVWLPALVALAFGVFALAFGAHTSFQVALNDFWTIAHLARELDLSVGESLHNGFFPIGGLVALRVVSAFAAAPVAAWMLSTVAAMVAIGICTRIVERAGGPVFALAVPVLALAHMRWLEYALSQMPDVWCGGWLALGTLVALGTVTDDEVGDRRRLMVAALCGSAALVRFHAGGWALGLVVAEAWTSRDRWRAMGVGLLGLAIGFAPQMVAGIAAGRGPLSTHQAFNVHKLVHGVDWVQTAHMDIPDSGLAVILDAPGRFALRYLDAWINDAWILVPGIVLVLLTSGIARRRAWMLSSAAAVYLVLVAAGDSPRALVPVVPLIAATTGLALHAAWSRWDAGAGERRVGATGFALIAVALAVAVSVRVSDLASHRTAQHDRMTELQTFVTTELGIASPLELYSDVQELALPDRAPWQPHIPGSWGRIDAWRYDVVWPVLDATDPTAFAEGARAAGIRWLLLSSACGRVGPALPAIASGQAVDVGLEPVGQWQHFMVVRVGDAP